MDGVVENRTDKNITDAEWLREYIKGYYHTNDNAVRLMLVAARLEQLEAAAVQNPPALGPNPSVSEIVQDWLKREWYSDIRPTTNTWFNTTDFWREASRFRAEYLTPDGSIGPERKE